MGAMVVAEHHWHWRPSIGWHIRSAHPRAKAPRRPAMTEIGSVRPFWVMSYLYELLGSKDANGRKH
jgi:hypothetical protein